MNYEEFTSVSVLDEAYRKTRRGKRGKRAEAIFESRETARLIALSNYLRSGKYEPAALDQFMIYEPKPRVINAPSFRDKIVQRALTDEVVYPALAPSIPYNAFAAQTGKGQHYGLDLLEKHMRTYFLRRKAADETIRKKAGLPYRPMEEWDYARGWVVKGDVRKCFPSTDHEKLKAAVFPKLPGPEFCYLLGKYIDQVDGLALGHQTSHICAVFYLSKALHYINQDLRCPMSGMYMDDWYAIVETKEQAVELLEKARKKFRELGYELNQKTGVFPLQNGIDFCGFHLYLTQSGRVIRKLRQSSKKRMKRRIRRWERDFKEGKITRREIEDSFQAWNAHAKHGDTRVLRQQLRERVDKIFKEARNEQKNQHPGGGKPFEAERKRAAEEADLPPV